MKHVVIGTAGHVDHGKTWLTKALTGTNTDRLKEEQERGITLDLGFAQLTLPNGQTASIVDVPGHESLVRNMIAGATGFDLVLLVIAADEGFMPQTQEHLDILSLLDVEQGIIALTKCDMVDSTWAAVVEEDIVSHVRGTFLEGAPIVRVSARTGEGIDALKQQIGELVEHARPKRPDRAYRLPIDRSFTVRGAGTVVTGTLVDGTLQAGSKPVVYPQGSAVRIRELQSHGEPAPVVQAGMRVAANLQGISRKEVNRGDVLAEEGSMLQGDRLLACLRITKSSPHTIKNSSNLHFYTGTEERVCRVRLLDADALQPGEQGFAQLLFQKPLTARNHDRFVVRFFSPMVTVGGGTILDIARGRAKRNNEALLNRLAQLKGSRPERIMQRVLDKGREPATRQDLMRRENLSITELNEALDELAARHRIVSVADGFVATEVFLGIANEARTTLRDFHQQHTLAPGMRTEELRKRLLPNADPGAGESPLLAELARRGEILIEKGYARLPDFLPSFTREQERLRESILLACDRAGFRGMRIEELGHEVTGGAPEDSTCLPSPEQFNEVLRFMERNHEIMMPTRDGLMSMTAWNAALDAFYEIALCDGSVTIGQFKEWLGISRKPALMLLEAFDRQGISQLVGNAHVALPRHATIDR